MPTETIHAAAKVPSRTDCRLLARSPKPEQRASEKTLGQLVDEYLATPIGSTEAERTRIAVLLRMGIRVSR